MSVLVLSAEKLLEVSDLEVSDLLELLELPTDALSADVLSKEELEELLAALPVFEVAEFPEDSVVGVRGVFSSGEVSLFSGESAIAYPF